LFACFGFFLVYVLEYLGAAAFLGLDIREHEVFFFHEVALDSRAAQEVVNISPDCVAVADSVLEQLAVDVSLCGPLSGVQLPLCTHFLSVSEDCFFEFFRFTDASEFLDFFFGESLLFFELVDDLSKTFDFVE